MKSIMSGAWSTMTTSPTDHRFESSRRKLGIWNDKVSKQDRQCAVTDVELLRKRGKPQSDCFGNLITGQPDDLAKMLVERVLNSLPAERSVLVSARNKWKLVELVTHGKIGCATKLLQETLKNG